MFHVGRPRSLDERANVQDEDSTDFALEIAEVPRKGTSLKDSEQTCPAMSCADWALSSNVRIPEHSHHRVHASEYSCWFAHSDTCTTSSRSVVILILWRFCNKTLELYRTRERTNLSERDACCTIARCVLTSEVGHRALRRESFIDVTYRRKQSILEDSWHKQ